MATQGFFTMGIDVKVGESALNYVTDIGDIGAAPSELDATCMKDSMKKTVPGVQDTKAFEVTFLFDNSAADSDYRVLKKVQDAGKPVNIEVAFPRRHQICRCRLRLRHGQRRQGGRAGQRQADRQPPERLDGHRSGLKSGGARRGRRERAPSGDLRKPV